MYIDRILAPITSLGPSERLVIWTKGCTKHCSGCANPELWSTDSANNYPVEDIFRIVRNIHSQNTFDGITISGGDPLEQKDEILDLLDLLGTLTDDILVYTGYLYSRLKEIWTDDELRRLERNVSVLIDGPYIEKLNTHDTVLRGSSNQNIIFFKEKFRPLYCSYLEQGRKIQNILMGEQFISVGIHERREDHL